VFGTMLGGGGGCIHLTWPSFTAHHLCGSGLVRQRGRGREERLEGAEAEPPGVGREAALGEQRRHRPRPVRPRKRVQRRARGVAAVTNRCVAAAAAAAAVAASRHNERRPRVEASAARLEEGRDVASKGERRVRDRGPIARSLRPKASPEGHQRRWCVAGTASLRCGHPSGRAAAARRAEGAAVCGVVVWRKRRVAAGALSQGARWPLPARDAPNHLKLEHGVGRRPELSTKANFNRNSKVHLATNLRVITWWKERPSQGASQCQHSHSNTPREYASQQRGS
jgi:hypothetical protein